MPPSIKPSRRSNDAQLDSMVKKFIASAGSPATMKAPVAPRPKMQGSISGSVIWMGLLALCGMVVLALKVLAP